MNNKNLKILFFKKDIDKNQIVEPTKDEPIITTLLKKQTINTKTNTKTNTNINTNTNTNTNANTNIIDENLNNKILISSLVKISSQQIISDNANNKVESTIDTTNNKLESTTDNVDNKLENNIDTTDNKLKSTTDNVDNKVETKKINKNQEYIDSLLLKIEETFELEKKNKLEELEQIKNDFINKNNSDKQSLKNYIKSKLENSKIPLVIYQTWMTKVLPEKMAKSIEKIKIANPEFEHKLFDDTDCRNFIINNFNDNVLYAYDNLIPGAFKADLWRYCVLYINGGIYLDVKYEPINNFKFMDLIDKDYFVLDRPSFFKGLIGIYNAFIISQPNNPIFLKLIKAIIDNVKNKYYGINALCITGPSLVGKILYPNNNKYTQLIEKEFDLKYTNDGLSIECKGKKILLQYPEYRRDQTKFTKTSYQNLWEKKKIFKN
jgi:mannosyltransferase OCH1-like enzyme